MRNALLCLLILAATAALYGQSTFATITGNVTDPAGAAVPNAKVEATETKTNYKYTAVTNDQGEYTLANIVQGDYTIRVEGAGFQAFQISNVLLASRDVRRIDAQLTVGNVGTSIEVTAGATLIETESARIADVKDRQVLRALPLTLRRAWDYFQQSPQVSNQGFQLRFAGSRNNQGEAAIDGTSIGRSGGGFASGPLMDRTEAYQEMRLDISGTSAEFRGAGQATLISRTGTNQFHGSFSDYYITPGLEALNPFTRTVTNQLQHRLTGAAGGPVYIPKIYNGKNRTFVFGTVEAGFGSAGIGTFTRTEPLTSWRGGDFSGLLPNTILRDPLTGDPFPGNIIPQSRINALSKAYQERFFSVPNFGNTSVLSSGNYREARVNQVSHQPNYTLRVDHRFSDKAFVFGRFTRVDWNLDGFELPLISERRYFHRFLRAATIGYTHTITPRVLNEFRWGTSFDDLPTYSRVGSGKAFAQQYGLQGLAPDLPDVGGILRVNFDTLGLSGGSVNSYCMPCSRDLIHEWIDNVTFFRGGHTIKTGVTIFRGFTNEVRQSDALFGSVNFSNRFTGNAYADFLLGLPSTMSRGFPAIEPARYNWTYAGFIQDDWKVTPRLTVNLGVRYDLYTGWKEQNGRQALFDIATGKIVVPDGALGNVSSLLPTNYVGVIEASKAGYNASSLTVPDKNNFGPRVGFAYRPFDNYTVVRGGFGLYYDIAPVGPSAGQTAPFYISEPAFTNPAATTGATFIPGQTQVFPTVFPASANGPTTINLPDAFRKDLKVPYSMQYNFTIERQQWNTGFRISYAGSNTRAGVYRWNVNQPVADTRLYTEKPRLFPAYPDILYRDNGAGHQYHSLAISAQRQMKNGLYFSAYWTYQRDIGDLENNEIPEDAYNRQRERAVWFSLPTHRVVGNIVYYLPVGKGRAFLGNMNRTANEIFGNWQISAIAIHETGNFLTPQFSGPDPTGTRFTTSATRPIVTLRPDQLRNPNLDNPTPDRWFDPTAFAVPPIGRFGTSAKGVIIGPPTNVLHATIAKEFLVKERVRFRLEALASNVLNHPNYQSPGLNISQTTAGVITSYYDYNTRNLDSAIPRVIQLQLRVEW